MIHDKLLEDIARHVALLDELRAKDLDLSNWIHLYAALHALQLHAQATINYLLHTCALLRCACETPMRCLDCLQLNGLISLNEAQELRRLIRFRNLLVHEYASIEISRIRKILAERGYARILNIVSELHRRLTEKGS